MQNTVDTMFKQTTPTVKYQNPVLYLKLDQLLSYTYSELLFYLLSISLQVYISIYLLNYLSNIIERTANSNPIKTKIK